MTGPYIQTNIYLYNTSAPSVKAPADRWQRHRAETGQSLLKGPADLWTLTHLKVASFFHASSAHNPICVLSKYTEYSCVCIRSVVRRLHRFNVLELKVNTDLLDMRFILLMFKYFDEALCTLVMLERPAQSSALFFPSFFLYDWLRWGGGREKKKER